MAVVQKSEILQDAYFVLPKPEKYEESSKQIHEIMSELFAEKYEINSDLVEARSAAIVASIILMKLWRVQTDDT